MSRLSTDSGFRDPHYATLPAAVVAQIEHDQAHTPPPSALQAHLLQWLRAPSPQPG